MSDEQTPREIIARLGQMSDVEFSQFMARHFDRLCEQPMADDPAIKTADRKGE